MVRLHGKLMLQLSRDGDGFIIDLEQTDMFVSFTCAIRRRAGARIRGQLASRPSTRSSIEPAWTWLSQSSAGHMVVMQAVTVLPGLGSYSAAGCNGSDRTFTDCDKSDVRCGRRRRKRHGRCTGKTRCQRQLGETGGAVGESANLTPPSAGGCGGGYSATMGMHLQPARRWRRDSMTSGTRIVVNGAIDVRAHNSYETHESIWVRRWRRRRRTAHESSDGQLVGHETIG